MIKFKIGDKVKICNKPQEDTDFVEWIDALDETCGLIGEIIEYANWDNSYHVESESGVWWYAEDWLEKIEEVGIKKQQPTTTWNNIEVSRGDVVAIKGCQLVFKVFDLTDTSALLEGHPTPVEPQDIIYIYKKSWEKPKELEEMSKEELIKLVKELKGCQ